jgi:hypothetical protein
MLPFELGESRNLIDAGAAFIDAHHVLDNDVTPLGE